MKHSGTLHLDQWYISLSTVYSQDLPISLSSFYSHFMTDNVYCLDDFQESFALVSGMAYRFTDISVMPIYRHFLTYRLLVSVKIRTDKISAIGYRLWPNIGSKYRLYLGDFSPIYR